MVPSAFFQKTLRHALAVALAAAVSAGNSCTGNEERYPAVQVETVENEAAAGDTREGGNEEGLIQVPPPPLSDGIFPCSNCHEGMEPNRTRRQLHLEHTSIKLEHDEEHRWCLDCHNPDDRDRLRLANGDLVSFEESYKLCGQCHGTHLRDWKAGVHGKRTGNWNGARQYLLCAHCHNPHSPRFRPIEPMPPPERPENLNIE